jgi:Phasin protein
MARKTTESEHLSRAPMAYLTDFSRFEGMTQMWMRPVQACLRWQADMLKATEPLATSWFERQLDATYFALEKIEKLARCGDLSEAVEIQREWFEAAAKRLTTELEQLTEQAASLSREAVSATRDVMPPVSEAAPMPKRSASEEKIEAAV